MSDVEIKRVSAEEADLRVDRWFKRHFPDLPFGRLAKLLRTGQVRVNGARAAPGDRLAAGAEIRVPPLEKGRDNPPAKKKEAPVSDGDVAALKQSILYEDDDVIAVNKWPSLAVQGGTKTERHLDAMLDALAAGGERPRLVHRLDRDTSGVLLLARTAAAAADLGKAFRKGRVEKVYWALVVGRPRVRAGEIDQPLEKAKKGKRGEQMVARADGQEARTLYQVLEPAGKRLAWLALKPVTGRTHQIRVHCAVMGTPIVGDRKYGGAAAMVDGFDKKLHLHARGLRFKDRRGKTREIVAPLPAHMRRSWDFLGLDDNRSAFADIGTETVS